MLSLNDKLIESKIKIEDYNRIVEDKKNINNLEQYNSNIVRINNRVKELNLIAEALENPIGDKINLESQIILKQSLKKLLLVLLQ